MKKTIEGRAGRKVKRPASKTRAAKRASKAVRTRTKPQEPSPAFETAKLAVAALEVKQGINPVITDVRNVSTITDYFVVVSAFNIPHLRALFDEVQITLKRNGLQCYRKAEESESGWLVLDYVDVVIHILLDERRKYYAIEDLWAEHRPAE